MCPQPNPTKNEELKAKTSEEVANELGTSGKDVVACMVRLIFYRPIPWNTYLCIFFL